MKNPTIALMASLLAATLIHADPAPFGMQIGKATVADVKAKYSINQAGMNKYSNGAMYELDPSELSMEGLHSSTIVFGSDGKLQAVLSTFSKDKFDYLFGTLKKKYKLVNSSIPFVGNKYAKFIDGNTEITLNAPHMSFEMDMNYVDKNLMKKFKQQTANEQQQKKNKEASQL